MVMRFGYKLIALSLMFSAPAIADTEINMTTRDADGGIAGYTKIYISDGRVRMDRIRGGMETDVSLIVADGVLTILRHKEQSFVVFDDELYAAVESRRKATVERIERRVGSLPEDQQAAERKKLQLQWLGSEPGVTDASTERSLQPTGVENWDSQPCSRFAVMRGEEMVREVCVVPFHAVIESEDIVTVLRGLADVLNRSAELMEVSANRYAYVQSIALVNEFDGFPVIAREVIRRRVVSETELGWMTETYVDPEMFAVPEGYSEIKAVRSR
ncbi:MAG: hypothetical protein AAF351_11320 [Pseudomonadota bacterium]